MTATLATTTLRPMRLPAAADARSLRGFFGVGLIVGGGVLVALSAIAFGNPALYSWAGGAAVAAGIAAVRDVRGRWVAVSVAAVALALFLWEWLLRAA